MENQKKSFWEVLGDKQKYGPALLLAVLLIGISFLTAGQRDPKGPAASPAPAEAVAPETDISRTERALEGRLKAILSQIEGAGEVEVTVFLATGTRYEYAVNVSADKRVIDEKDQAGGVRLTTEDRTSDQYVLIRGSQTQEEPVVIQERSPQIQGVLIVAEGARQPAVRAKLQQAVQVALGLEAHRIQVLPRKER